MYNKKHEKFMNLLFEKISDSDHKYKCLQEHTEEFEEIVTLVLYCEGIEEFLLTKGYVKEEYQYPKK